MRALLWVVLIRLCEPWPVHHQYLVPVQHLSRARSRVEDSRIFSSNEGSGNVQNTRVNTLGTGGDGGGGDDLDLSSNRSFALYTK